MRCKACRCEEFTDLGVLGFLHWYRCRACGLDQYRVEEGDDE